MALVLTGLLAGPNGAAVVMAAEAVSSGIVSFESLEVAEDQVSVGLSAAAKYNSFLTSNPPRLVVELLNTEYQAGAKAVEGKGRYLKRVRSGQFERAPRMVSRIVIDLKESSSYRIDEQSKGLLIRLVKAEETAPEPTKKEAPAAAVAASTRPVVSVAAAPKAAPQAVVSEPVKKETPAAPTVVASAPKPAVSVAAAPSKDPEAGSMSTEHAAELAAMAKPDPEKAVKPKKAEPPPQRSAEAGGSVDIMSRLPRDLVTLDFDNMDIQDIIKLLAAKAKINIIYGNDVRGALTLHLTDVPFNQAFGTILSMMGLTTMQVGDNILRILTLPALVQSRASAASITKVIPLSYSKASEIVAAVNAVRLAEGRTGTASPDTKTNSLIVTEPLEGLAATERLIAQLDVRPKQVLIEAKLVEVGLNNSLHHGIQWDYLSSERGVIGGQQGTNLIGTLTSPQASASPTLTPLDGNGNAIPGVGAAGRGTGVSLPASSVFGALTLGRITNNYFLSATLTAAAAQGKVRVLSDPKIATLNNQPATINVTTSIPYVTSNVASTGVQTQSVAYVVTGIKLAVTPTINADGRITLDINPDVSQPSATAAASATGAPAVDSRNAKTTVLVRDGETIVIGGLISDSESNQVAKIPILGDIPILGWLFRKKSVIRTRSELLIFVTPKILTD